MPTIADTVLSAAKTLSNEIGPMDFSPEATHVYNPLDYAWEPYKKYIETWGNSTKKVLFLGMNPGPFGMAQTGIAFGEIASVRDWIGITAPVGKPPVEHPSRPIQGFECTRAEVSGKRLWGMFAEEFKKPENFFRDHLVMNYCPLLFLDGSANRCRNLTPDKLPAAKTEALYRACNQHLVEVVEALKPEWVVGVGKFAETQASRALKELDVKISTVLHPSPASPIANRGWAPQALKQLRASGIWKS